MGNCSSNREKLADYNTIYKALSTEFYKIREVTAEDYTKGFF
jgi:hypothetical protein